MKIKQKIVWVALAAISATTAQAQGLKDAYKDYFTIGVAVNKHNIAQPEQIALIKREFNSVTAENDMKPVSVHPKEGVWNWGGCRQYCQLLPTEWYQTAGTLSGLAQPVLRLDVYR